MRISEENAKKRDEQLKLFEFYNEHLGPIEKAFTEVFNRKDKRIFAEDLERCGMETGIDAAWFISGLMRAGIIDGDCVVLMPEPRIQWLLREAKIPASRYAGSSFRF
jgi:hypothetical protein